MFSTVAIVDSNELVSEMCYGVPTTHIHRQLQEVRAMLIAFFVATTPQCI